MGDQFDLFGGPNAAKKEGMERVDANANEQWKREMYFYAVETARRKQLFTSDDVFDLARERGINAETHDKRAFGPIMLRVAKAGICVKADIAARNSNRVSLHASPRAWWRSLIFGWPAKP